MKIVRFEDILSWKKSRELTVFAYKIFRENKDFGFEDQIQRASISIGNNFVECFERKSDNEFKQFLFIAKGSSGEVWSVLDMALELKYINEENFKKSRHASFRNIKITLRSD